MENAENQHITCPCGFEVSGPNSEQNVEALKEHEHWEEDEPKHWTRYVFSFEGALVALVLSWSAIEVIKIFVK